MLDIVNISKTFNPGTVNEKKALSGLSLHLDEGDFVTIVGSNGAGKSTLFNAIAGSFYVDEGSISLAGRDITFMPEHERSHRIGRLFQDPLRGTAPDGNPLAWFRDRFGSHWIGFPVLLAAVGGVMYLPVLRRRRRETAAEKQPF